MAHANVAIIGISLNNPYFSQDTIEQLITTTSNNYKQVYLVIPDEPSIFNELALGTSLEKATRRVKEQIQKLLKKIPDPLPKNVIFLKSWERDIVKVQPMYQQALDYVMAAYDESDELKSAIIKLTKPLLEKSAQRRKLESKEVQVDYGVQYLLHEYAFFLTCHLRQDIIETSQIDCIYRRPWLILPELIMRKYANLPQITPKELAERLPPPLRFVVQ